MNPLPRKQKPSRRVMRKNSTDDGPRTRVLIADNHRAFAGLCRSTLEPEFEVVGIAADGLELLDLVAELTPDVVVVDLVMPEMNGLEAGERVKAINPATKTIYMTLAAGFDLAAEAFRQGAAGFVDKSKFPAELLIAVRWAMRGDLRLSSSLLGRHDLSQSP